MPFLFTAAAISTCTVAFTSSVRYTQIDRVPRALLQPVMASMFQNFTHQARGLLCFAAAIYRRVLILLILPLSEPTINLHNMVPSFAVFRL